MSIHVDISHDAHNRADIRKNYSHFGYWWSNTNIELIKIGSRVFALQGWDGEAYKLCWECQNIYPLDSLMEVKDKSTEYILKPQYLFELENIDLAGIEENSDRWNQLHEIVNFSVKKRVRIRARVKGTDRQAGNRG